MVDYLTNLLQKKCKEENCEVLYGEWVREKELSEKILTNVSNMAPNFSI